MPERINDNAWVALRRLLVAAAVLLTVTACGGGGGVGGGSSSSSPAGAPPPSPIPAPSGSAPIVSLSASKSTVNSGDSADITWSVTKATSCTGSGGWSGAKATTGGSETVGPLTNTKSFLMSCTGSGGTTEQSVTIAVLKASQPPPLGSTIATVNFQNRSSSAAADLPVTFGHVFVRGDVPSGATLVARTAGSGSQSVPIQLDEVATHADGSLRYAVISTRVPSLAGGATQPVELVSAAPTASAAPVALSDLLNTGYDAEVSLDVGGIVYSASARDLLQAGPVTTWLHGPLVTEWVVSAPVKTAGGTAHPHLAVRFNIRAYAGMDSVRTDIVVENDWTYEPNPQNVAYTATIKIGGATVYTKTLTHYTQTRWRKVFWWGRDPQVDVRFDKSYLLATGALPNFDQTLAVPESALASLASDWSAAPTDPMGAGLTDPFMPDTGARPDIGPLTQWDALYLLSGDPRAERASLGSGDLAGSWPIHYRDKNTGRPVSLNDFPYMTILGNVGDTRNPATGQLEAFPDCGGDCSTPFEADSAHQPSLAYLPYLVTGDQYYLEELQFWTTWNALHSNPHFRDFDKGLAKWDQVRGQAWTLRTLGQAAYITPDAGPLKSYFVNMLQANLDWYNSNFTNNTGANNFGILTTSNAIVYENFRGVAPWQDDFFTWSIGYLVDMGFSDAAPLLAWKAKFPVARMTDPGWCWISGAAYSVNLRDDQSSPLYTTFAQIYAASIDPAVASTTCGSSAMASALGLSTGEMTGFSFSPTGYPSNMQPALAVAVDSGIPNSGAAWSVFMGRTVKPDYSGYPNYAIVPRTSP